eukprot:g2995.t1
MEVYCCGAELFLGNEKCEAMVITHDGDGDENDEKQIADQLKGALRIFGKPFAMRREIKQFGVRIPSRIGGSKADATFRAQAKQAIYLGEIIAKEALKGRDDVNARAAWSTNDWCITARVRHLLVVRAIEQCGERTPDNDATTEEILTAACTSRLRLVGCQQEIIQALRPAYTAALLQGIQKTARKAALKWMQQYPAARDSPQTILVACLGLQPEDQESRRKVLESDVKVVSLLPPSREVIAVFQCKNNIDQQNAQSNSSYPAQSAITISKVDGTNAAVTSINEAGQACKRKIFNAVLPDEDLLLDHVARSIKFHAAALEACRDALQGGQSARRISIFGWSSRAAESSPVIQHLQQVIAEAWPSAVINCYHAVPPEQGEVGEQENRDVRVEVFAPSGWEDEKPPEVEAENDMGDLLLQRFQELLEDERTGTLKAVRARFRQIEKPTVIAE